MIAEPDDVLLGPATFATARLGVLTSVIAGAPVVALDPIGESVFRAAWVLLAGARVSLGRLGCRIQPLVARRRGGCNRPLWSFGALGRPDFALLRTAAAGLATFRPRLERARVLDNAGTAFTAFRLLLARAAVLDWLRTGFDDRRRFFACGSLDGLDRPLGAFGRAP